MEKIETRGRPRNPKFKKICGYILSRVERQGRINPAEGLSLPELKHRRECKSFRDSTAYKELRLCLLGKGLITSLYYSKKTGAFASIVWSVK